MEKAYLSEGIKSGAGAITEGLSDPAGPLALFLSGETPDNKPNKIPQAYLHMLFFNENLGFEPDYSSVQKIKAAAQGVATQMVKPFPIKRNGYVFIYFSNESESAVWFDNFQVAFRVGPLLEETHYYPFGLTMVGISSKALDGTIENKRAKFQGQELNDDLGVNVYEFKYRMHDYQTGRFWQIDPLAEDYVYNSTYAFSENKVISHVELEGLEAQDFRDGDQKGMIKNATAEYSAQHPVLGLLQDVSHTLLSAVGVNFMDNIIDDAFNNPSEVLNTTANGLVEGMSMEGMPIGRGTISATQRGLQNEAKVLKEMKAIDGAKAVNGNSKASTKAQHVYEIFETGTDNVVKPGISGGKVSKTEKSYRASSQVNKMNKAEGAGKYDSRIVEKIPAGQGARQEALRKEKINADKNRKTLDPEKHKRP